MSQSSSSFSFRASVADEAMTKVSRLFNASLRDILCELLQNARRAGATCVTVDRIDDPTFGPSVRVADNGLGLENYLSLFMLGRSGWASKVCQSEDAAGMGFFSLANRGARIIAQEHGTDRSWILNASAPAFSGDVPVEGGNGPAGHQGVTIIFPTTAGDDLTGAVTKAARYCPLDVTLNGEATEHSDFLGDASHIEEWRGVRIGVYHGPRHYAFGIEDNINFHGVTLRATLPLINQQFHPSYYARIDVTHCTELKLVLPARKEIVQTAFFDELRSAILSVFYRLIEQGGEHSLSHEDYRQTHAFGVDLPEAAMQLRPFSPIHADSGRNTLSDAQPVNMDAILYDRSDGSIEEQNVAMALSKWAGDFQLHEPVTAFNGYTWYDRLRCVALTGYRVVVDGRQHDIRPGDRFTIKQRPDRIWVELECGDGSSIEPWPCETDLIVIGEDDDPIDDADIHVTASSKLTPAVLTDVLEAALFCPSDDVEAGSYDEQRQRFCDEAEDIAFLLLRSREATDVNAIVRTLRRELLWRLPQDRPVTIRVYGADISVEGLSDPTRE